MAYSLFNLFFGWFNRPIEVGAGQSGYGNFLPNTFVGHNGALLLSGGYGNDTFITDGFVAKIDGGGGYDTLRITGVDGYDSAGHVGELHGIEKILVTAGLSTVSFSRYAPTNCDPQGLNIQVADVQVAGVYQGAFIIASEYSDCLTGGKGNDTLVGNKGDDTIRGGDGDDDIQGGVGHDRMYGDAGNDTFKVFSGTGQQPDVIVDGGAGIDLISLRDTFFTTGVSLDFTDPSVLQNIGGTSVVNVEIVSFVGTDFADKAIGGAYNDFLDLQGGDDILKGAGGNDTLIGGTGFDTAVYSGSFTNYVFTRVNATTIQVTDTRAGAFDGTDRLTSIEALKFADMTVTAASLGI